METLESIVGAPMSDWFWLKASLPSSCGGLNLRTPVLHARAAFIASSVCSQSLVGNLLDMSPEPSPYMTDAVAALSSAANRPDGSV